MHWPLSQDYNEAIQSPQTSFSDPELQGGQAVVNTLGLPVPCSGNFADVYQFVCPQTRWAVKCFTREVRDQRERYAEISRYLEAASLSFTVEFKYLEKGIRIRGTWYPILKMRWVEGMLLNVFVRENLHKPSRLEALSEVWTRMAKRLREAKLAHADLQHGNVILVPGSTANTLTIKLIDYDGMFIPALAGKTSGEVGHPSYQHPRRLKEGTYNAEVDRFPLLVVATALRALTLVGPKLWARYDNGDNLLFKESDLRSPAESALFRDLRQIGNAELRALVKQLAQAVSEPLEQCPLLGEAGAATAVASSAASAIPGTFVEGLAAHALPRAIDSKEPMRVDSLPGGRGKSSRRERIVGIIAAGIAILGLMMGLIVWATWPAGSKKQADAAQANQKGKPLVKGSEDPPRRRKDQPIQDNKDPIKTHADSDGRVEWINTSYNTTISHVGGKVWSEIDNTTGKQKSELIEQTRTPEYIELKGRFGNFFGVVRIRAKRMDMLKDGKWEWSSNGSWANIATK